MTPQRAGIHVHVVSLCNVTLIIRIIHSLSLYRYHFTTGKFPFEGETIYKLFHVITIGTFSVPPDLPPLLQDLIKGINKNNNKYNELCLIGLHV